MQWCRGPSWSSTCCTALASFPQPAAEITEPRSSVLSHSTNSPGGQNSPAPSVCYRQLSPLGQTSVHPNRTPALGASTAAAGGGMGFLLFSSTPSSRSPAVELLKLALCEYACTTCSSVPAALLPRGGSFLTQKRGKKKGEEREEGQRAPRCVAKYPH